MPQRWLPRADETSHEWLQRMDAKFRKMMADPERETEFKAWKKAFLRAKRKTDKINGEHSPWRGKNPLHNTG